MSHLVHKSLQQSLYALLSGDATLGSVISGVFIHPPEQQAYPYIVIDSLTSRDWSTRTTLGFSTIVPLLVYGQNGQQEVLDIMDRIYELVVEGSITLLDHQLVALRFEMHEVVTEDDAVTQRGTLRFRAYSEFIPV